MPLLLSNQIDWRELLTNHPPGTKACVTLQAQRRMSPINPPELVCPELRLHCPNCGKDGFCDGTQVMRGQLFPGDSTKIDFMLHYVCQQCKLAVKTYAVRVDEQAVEGSVSPTNQSLAMEKMGEWPPFSIPTPSRLISMIGPDRELFLKGRRAEFEGLGVGAFAYYRRIVENQKDRFLDQIIQVGRRTNASADLLGLLEAAKKETQFSKAVHAVKDALPQVLFIKGRNPLTLLHTALSRGIHAASDDECLKAANDVRIVLVELAERVGMALKEDNELNEALNRLGNAGG